MFTYNPMRLLTAPPPSNGIAHAYGSASINRISTINANNNDSSVAIDTDTDTSTVVVRHHAGNCHIDCPTTASATSCRTLDAFTGQEEIELDVISPVAQRMLLRESTTFVDLVSLAAPPAAHLAIGCEDSEVATASFTSANTSIHHSDTSQALNHNFINTLRLANDETISISNLSFTSNARTFTDDEQNFQPDLVEASANICIDRGIRAQRRRGFYGVENQPSDLELLLERAPVDATAIPASNETSELATEPRRLGEYHFESGTDLIRNPLGSQFLEFSTLNLTTAQFGAQNSGVDYRPIRELRYNIMEFPFPRKETKGQLADAYNEHFMALHCIDSSDYYNRGIRLELPTDKAKFTKGWYFHMVPVYQTLFVLALLANTVLLTFVLFREHDLHDDPPYSSLLTGFAANLYITSQVRQDIFINLLYKAAWMIPHSLPLWFRAIVARIYENGGVHSGCALSAIAWFVTLTAFLTIELAAGSYRYFAAVGLCCIILSTLLTMSVTAVPNMRQSDHNNFEHIHRWGAWIVLIMGWVLLVTLPIVQQDMGGIELGTLILKSPATWLLIASTLIAIWPWLFLRRLRVTSVRFSDHAIQLFFTLPVSLNKGLRLSESPFGDYHSFAIIPSRDGGRSGGSVIISSAGDWTKRNILKPRPYYWVKGVPVTGFLCVASLFKRIVIVTTGSGIGPCLGVIQDLSNTLVRLGWSVRSPWATYGEENCKAVLRVDCFAAVIDTHLRVGGHPDIALLAYQEYLATNAEAVFVISNKKVTEAAVEKLRAGGIYAFVPVFDS